jgi:hypothetical protein
VLDIGVVTPGEAAWSQGTRTIACMLYHSDFQPLTGTVRGTAR